MLPGRRGSNTCLPAVPGAPVDILYMLPSCVPATPLDIGGASLDAEALAGFLRARRYPRTWRDDELPRGARGRPGNPAKTCACTHIRDGHAPLLSGMDLNAYILAGLQSDHECTTREEAEEKLRRGMYIFIREGSTEKNIAALIPMVTPEQCVPVQFCDRRLPCRSSRPGGPH